MENSSPQLQSAAETILAAIQQRRPDGNRPFLVALDGGSGAGKSTLASIITQMLDAALIQSDDFYAAYIPDAEWDASTPEEKVRDVIDWRRLRAEALEPLLAGESAKWHPFDFEKRRADGTYPLSTQVVERPPADLIVLDGAYTTRPELADLIDLSVLVDVPIEIRHQRLAAREPADFLASWHARWDESEAYYFTHVRPPSSFDLVVNL